MLLTKRVWQLLLSSCVLVCALGLAGASYADSKAKPTKKTVLAVTSEKKTEKNAEKKAQKKTGKQDDAAKSEEDDTDLDAAYNDGEYETFKDPYERFNRDTFAFNDFWDRNLLKPVAEVYKKIVPTPLREGVTNFFRNINTVSTIVDDLLQLKFYQATSDTWRLAINTTIGIGGLFDVATRMGLPFYENDFGMVLAQYGWKNSNYLVLPFYGSYTVRDGFSLPVDFFLLSAYSLMENDKVRYGLYALSVVNTRADALKYDNLLSAAALDKYTFVRNAHLQHRKHQLKQNQQLSYKNPLNGGQSESLDEETIDTEGDPAEA